MDWQYFKQVMKIFCGIFLLIVSFALFLLNAFALEAGFDVSLLLLNLLLLLGGLLCIVFGVSRLSDSRK